MTYCCGILVRDGLVMIADTRTNAGLDNVSTFRKLHIFSKPGERIMAIASAGNLAISQSVLSILNEGLEDPHTGERQTLMNAPTMFQAAQRIGRAIRMVHATEGPALRSEDVSFDVSFLFGGQTSSQFRGGIQPQFPWRGIHRAAKHPEGGRHAEISFGKCGRRDVPPGQRLCAGRSLGRRHGGL